jgi:hypothetical protein
MVRPSILVDSLPRGPTTEFSETFSLLKYCPFCTPSVSLPNDDRLMFPLSFAFGPVCLRRAEFPSIPLKKLRDPEHPKQAVIDATRVVLDRGSGREIVRRLFVTAPALLIAPPPRGLGSAWDVGKASTRRNGNGAGTIATSDTVGGRCLKGEIPNDNQNET